MKVVEREKFLVKKYLIYCFLEVGILDYLLNHQLPANYFLHFLKIDFLFEDFLNFDFRKGKEDRILMII